MTNNPNDALNSQKTDLVSVSAVKLKALEKVYEIAKDYIDCPDVLVSTNYLTHLTAAIREYSKISKREE